jgi:large repetitive protein
MGNSLFGSVSEMAKLWSARRALRKSAERRLYSACAIFQNLEARQLLSATALFPANGHPAVADSGTDVGKPVDIVVGDLDINGVGGDGIPDVVMLTTSGKVQIFSQGNNGSDEGNGNFSYFGGYSVASLDESSAHEVLSIGEATNGDPFIAVVDETGTDKVELIVGDGSGDPFNAYTVDTSAVGNVYALTAYNDLKFSGVDGPAVVISSSTQSNTGAIYGINGTGGATVKQFFGAGSDEVGVGDFDGDGTSEIVLNTSTLDVYGGVTGQYQVGTGSYFSFSIGKLNPSSSIDDLAALTASVTSQNLVTFVGGPGGLPVAGPSYSSIGGGYLGGTVQIADVVGDGTPDITITKYMGAGTPPQVYAYTGNGKGGFTTPFSYYGSNNRINSKGYNLYEGTFADTNGDGKADLVFSYYNSTADYSFMADLDNNDTSIPPTTGTKPALTTTTQEFSTGDVFTTGQAGSFTFSASGTPPPSITLDSTLPAGLTFTDNGNGTATISGTPAPGTGGAYEIVITLTNSAGTTTIDPPLIIDQPTVISSATAATFETAQSGSFTVTTTGYPNPTITEVGSLDGLTFVDNGDGTATLSGIPTALGEYPITITAGNGIGTAENQSFTIIVNQSPTFTDTAFTQFTVGTGGNYSITTTGFPTAPVLSLSAGTLPAGVTFLDNGDGTGALNGTPDALTGGVYYFTIEADNGVLPPAYQSFALFVVQAPAITSANNTTFTVGSAGAFTVTTIGFPVNAVITDAVEGANTTTLATLGLTLTSVGNGTAILSGTPAAGTGGVYTYTITANNGVAPNATQVFTLTIDQDPAITSANTVTVTVGTAMATFNVTTTGFPSVNPELSISAGALPEGLLFTDTGNGTATITGTPGPLTGGTYDLTIEANNNIAPPAYQNFILIVGQAPIITSTNNTTFTVGATGTFTVTSTGFPANAVITDAVEGANTTTLATLGLTLTSVGNGTAILSGTPLAGTGGVYTYTITANNGVAPNATQIFTLTIDQAPAITSADTVTVTVGTAMATFNVTTTGFPSVDPELSISAGSLPAGLLFADNGNGTATITGTPGPLTGGSYDLEIEANNGVAPPAFQSFILVVGQAPAITSTNNTAFTVGTPGTFTITTTGFPANAVITDAVEGANTTTLATLGLTLTSNGNGTATLSGTPLANTGGVYTYTITASNGVAPNATQVFTLTIYQAPTFTSAAKTTFTVGTAGSFSVTTSLTEYPRNPALTLITGTLPNGVTFVDNGNGTGTLSGTPDALTGGTYDFTIEANNGVFPPALQTFVLTVDQDPAITSVNNTAFIVGTPGNFLVTTTGFPVPVFGLTPAATTTLLTGLGLKLTDNGNGTATLSGTPLAATGGVYTFTIAASNGTGTLASQLTAGTAVEQTFTLTIYQPATFTSVPEATFTVGDAGSFTVTTSLTEFPRNPALTLITGSLPAGVTFVDNGNGTGTLAGTPLAQTGGVYDFTIEANNGVFPPALQTFVLTVDQPPAITSKSTTTFEVGLPGTFTVTTTGFPIPVSSVSGATTTLLTSLGTGSGLKFKDNGDGTATLFGTPAAGTGGSYTFTITASNVDDETGTPTTVTSTQSFTLVIDQLPVFTNPPYILTLQNVVDPQENDQSNRISMNYNFVQLPVEMFDSFDIDTTGYSPAGETMTLIGGNLPKGMTFVDNGDGTATISGVPQHAGADKETITVQTNYIGVGTKNAVISLDIDGAEVPTITSASSKTLLIGSQDIAGTQAGTAGFFTFTSTGFPKANFSLTGVVPSGSGGEDGTTETITSGETLADFGLPDLTFTDNGDGTATISGSLQTGVDLPDVYTFVVNANNGIKDVTKTFTLTVQQAIDFTSPTPTDLATQSQWIGTPLTTGMVGDGYDFDVTTNINNNSNLPKAKLTASGLPSGLKFVDNGDGSGVIEGDPKKAGTFTVTITATQGSLSQKIKSTLIIDGPSDTPALKTTTVNVKKNTVINKSIALTGGPAPISVDQATISGLPDGLTLTGNGSKSNPELILKGAVGAGDYTVTFNLVALDGTENSVTLTIDAA